MTVLDALYATIIFSVIITTILINMILYQLWRSIRNMRKSTEKVFSATQQVINLKNRAKLAILKPVYHFLNRLKKPGSRSNPRT